MRYIKRLLSDYHKAECFRIYGISQVAKVELSKELHINKSVTSDVVDFHLGLLCSLNKD